MNITTELNSLPDLALRPNHEGKRLLLGGVGARVVQECQGAHRVSTPGMEQCHSDLRLGEMCLG